MSKSPQELAEHARQLAAAFKVRLIESDQLKPDEAFADARRRLVLVAPVIEETTYAVVLHELGHLVSPTGNLRHVDGNPALLQLDEETAAWAWARHYALEWTPVMEALAAYCMSTYTGVPVPAQPPVRTQPVPPIAWHDETKPKPPATKPAINWKEWNR